MYIKCEFCDRIFDTPYEYAEHLEVKIYELIGKKEDEVEVVEEQSETETPETDEKPSSYIKGNKLDSKIGNIIIANKDKSPKDMQVLIKQKTGLDVPLSTIYNWKHNHLYKKKWKKKKQSSSDDDIINVIKGKTKRREIVDVIKENIKLPSKELQAKVQFETGQDVPMQRIYAYQNYYKNKKKGKVVAEKEEVEVAEVEEVGHDAKDEVFSSNVVQILNTYPTETPQELSDRIRSSLGVQISAEKISAWKESQ